MSLHRLLCALAFFLCCVASAHADIFRSADIRLDADEHGDAFNLTVQGPGDLVRSGAIILPEGCQVTSENAVEQGRQAFLSFEFVCEDGLPEGAQIFAPWNLDGARFDARLPEGVLSKSLIGAGPGIEIPLSVIREAPRPWHELVSEFIYQGVVHIWFGWDHLAFVACLCLLARGRALMGLITSFTLGHSISLGLTFFQVLQVPIAPVEAIIALSIAVMAREAIVHGRDETGERVGRQMVVVTIFGLLHGMGFASALGELGVLPQERWPALIAFNVGVELGQVTFVFAMLMLFRLMHFESLKLATRLATLGLVGVTGGFWTVERIASFWGYA